MSRNPHKPTPESRAEVAALKSFGVNQGKISVYLGIDEKTLRKYYREELDTAQTKADANVAKFLYNAASGEAIESGASHSDCIRAAMFWAKTRMQWRETGENEAPKAQPIEITFTNSEPDE